MQFEHTTLGQRVLFGTGLAAQHVAQETTRLSATKIMCIASEFERGFAETALAQVQVALWHTDVVQHVPVENAVAARGCRNRGGNRPHRVRGRGLDHGLGQGRGADHRDSHHCRTDHLCRLGSHQCLGHDRGRHQDHRGG